MSGSCYITFNGDKKLPAAEISYSIRSRNLSTDF